MSTEPVATTADSRVPSRLRRLTPVLGLLLLSPYCAEFLIGYQGVVVNPVGLLAGVLFVAPLYGTVAVLIREAARRAGRGWPTILLLCAAAGLVQAGLIDQSLFHHEVFDGTPYWQALTTRIPGADVDASQLLVFVGGHVIWSFGAPIAVVEACVPPPADRPWLGRAGIAVLVALYLAGAVLFLNDLVLAPGLRTPPAQLIGTGVVVAALVVAAFAIPRRSVNSSARAPHAWLVGVVVLLLLAAFVLVNDTWGWLGVALAVLMPALLGTLLMFWSGYAGWDRTHTLAAGGAALLVYAMLAFAVAPQGASPAARYVSSAVVLVAVLALLTWARHRLHVARPDTDSFR